MTNALGLLGRQFDTAIIPVLQANSIGKMLMPVNPQLSGKGLGVLSIETFNYVARNSAVTDYDINQDMAGAVDVTGAITRIPVQQDDVVIKRRDWDAYAQRGVPIQNDLAQDMAVNIALQQNAAIIDGWKPNGSTYMIKGCYQVANNTYGGADSGTFGNVLKNVNQGIGLLKADKVYSRGYDLVLATFNMAELEASIQYGIKETALILDSLNRGLPPGQQPGQIYEDANLTAGTGFVKPIGSQENIRFFDIIETQIPVNQVFYDQGNEASGDVRVRQIGALVPRFKHLTSTGVDDCICTITGMGSS